MLHLVRTSPFATSDLQTCLDYSQPGDIILLMQDGVIAATLPTWQEILQNYPERELFVLEADLMARGLTARLGQVIDDQAWVALTASQESSLTW